MHAGRGGRGAAASAQWYAARPAGGTTRSSRAASVGVAGGLGGSVAPTSVRTDSVGVQVDACRRRTRGPDEHRRRGRARVAAAAARGAGTRGWHAGRVKIQPSCGGYSILWIMLALRVDFEFLFFFMGVPEQTPQPHTANRPAISLESTWTPRTRYPPFGAERPTRTAQFLNACFTQARVNMGSGSDPRARHTHMIGWGQWMR